MRTLVHTPGSGREGGCPGVREWWQGPQENRFLSRETQGGAGEVYRTALTFWWRRVTAGTGRAWGTSAVQAHDFQLRRGLEYRRGLWGCRVGRKRLLSEKLGIPRGASISASLAPQGRPEGMFF